MKTVLYPLAMSAFLCLQAQTLGATHSVEILRDPWGIPHVVAEAEADGFFGLGCAAAEDRLLQMELIRRKAAGRLAEVFGPDWVDADREARIAGHPYDLGPATGGTGDTSRSLRLRQLLEGDRKFSLEDFELALHRDDVNPWVTEQLRSAAVLGVYLIEESAAGRLKVPYGSPHVLEGLRALLKELGESDSSDRRGLRGVQPEEASQPRSPRAAGQPEVWLCAGERIADLLRPEAEWSFVKQHLSGFKLYVDQINTAPPEQLAALVSLAKEHHYQIAVELGGCLDFAPMDDTAGEWSARHELAKIEKWYAAGGQVDFLDLDGPIRRLMHPENRQDGQHYDSIERAVDELVGALRLHRQAHPKTRFWLLTNFPNWGYRGDVSYHARRPQRQDYGDYDAVIGVVLRKLRAAQIPLAGVTVDNPYGYLMGEHPSVNLKDPKSVNWLKRVRSYEDFAREQGLEFNLIVNSERGGNESDERFHRETLAMVDTYRDADGRPTRWLVQSWYPYPKQIVPETAPHSMAALVKAVIERVNPGEAMPTHRPAPVDASAAQHGRQNDLGNSGSRIVLQPQPGAMQVTARVPALDNQAFALGIPETIGCREAMLVNFPEAKIEWQGPDRQGVVSCSWGPGGRISYTLRLIPAEDYVDVEMTIRNHTEFLWHDVFAFNCLNPILAPVFQDWKLERTYMSAQGKPLCMAKTSRVKGHMPTVGFYLPERIKAGEESVFVRGFGATSPDRTDGSWIVTLSDAKSAFMAATAFEAAFLFDNLDRCCLHAAPSFGDIGPGESSTTVSRLYLAQGTLDDFLKRQEVDSPGLAARQKWARGAKSAAQPPGSRDGALAGGVKSTDETRPRRRMEDTPDKPSFEQYLRKAALSQEVIDRFLRGPSWAQFDSELGYILGNYLPSDGMDGSATLSTVQANGARTSFVYAGRKCRINTYGDSFTQCHQVSDAETWQEYLAGHLGEPIRNFGMGGYGVYQAYRRMLREERTDHAADYVIFYIWGDDHIRSLLRCRHAIIYPWWDHQGGPMFHNNFWPNLELDLQTGQFVEKENLLRTRDSLYRMTDPEWMVETLRDDLALELFAFRQGLIRDLDQRRIDPLAARLGFSMDWDRRSTLQAQAGELLDRYSLRATRFVLDKARSFARENHKKLLVVLFDPSRAMTQMRRSETRYDQEIVDYLTKEQFNYFDMNEVQLRDFKKSNRSYEDYQRQYFIGHYSPRGNHFFAYSIKDVVIKWLDPKPITYRAPDPQLIDFRGYLPDAP